jgi:hypothetical protein
MREITIQELRTALFSGLNGRFVMIGTAYLDDSADANQSVAFVAAGFFCVDPEWKRLRREWRRILKPHGIRYFRATDCRNLQGGFANLKEKWGEARARQIADRIRQQLADLVENSGLLIGFGFGINMHDFWEVDAMPEARACTQWMRECHDYQTYAFRNMFCKITHTVMRLTTDENYLIFICDDSTHQRKIRRGFERVKKKYPELGERMLSLAPMDDKKIPELQMADFMADVAREMVTRHLATAGAQAEPAAIKTRVFSVECSNKHSMLRVLSGEAKGV